MEKCVVIVSIITHISAEGIGKIHIGESRNSTTSNTKFYSWPFYQKTGLLPIYLSVRNYSIASDVLNFTENVTVYCQQNPSTNGFSLVQFSPLHLIPPITEGYVSVEFLRPGRPVTVQCFGTSRNLSLNPQFLNDTSLSKPRLLVITRSPVVNVCNTSIIIPFRNQSRNITGVITAMLSEPTTSSVTVVCQQEVLSEQVVCQQEQNDWNTIQIMLENLTVPNNSKSFEISYTVKELGSPVQVYCEANSSEGNQYLLSTSRGYPTRFQQNQVFLNFHPSTLKVKTLSFQVYLSYTTLIIEDIMNSIIQCDVVTIDCSQSIAAVSKCFPVPSVANNTFNVSSEIQKKISDNVWELDERIFKVNNEPFYKLLQLRRTSIAEVDIKETVEMNCFVVSVPNINATFKAFVSLKPSVEYNISSISLQLEAHALNNIDPLSKNFVPCSCDLKVMMCDINCCCDSDCQDFQELNFNQCPKEDMEKILLAHLCETQMSLNIGFDLNSWFCVERKDNAFLGIYYSNHPVILNPTSFREIWSETYSYREKNTPQSSLNEGNGNLITNGHPSATNYLPQKIFSGQCITSAPLPFLVNITSDCTSYIDNDICSKSSVLSATSYVLPTSLIDSNCVSPSNNVLTDVNYFCAKNVNFYVKTDNTAVNDWKEDFNKSVNKNKLFETRCSWDDSYTKPPVPTVRKRQNEVFCDNVVLHVNYQFTWNKTGITFLNVSIILGNVSISKINQSMEERNVSKTGSNNNNTCLNESITHLTQHFKVSYLNDYNQSESKPENSESENPGYLPGRPIQSGINIVNNTKSFFIDQNITQQIFVWNPDPSGFCALAGKRWIMFGEDIYSSCFVPLKQVGNCETLRKEVLYLLNQLIPADRIGRFQHNDGSIESHWIKILRPNISEIFPDTSNSSNSSRNINNNSNQTNIFHDILMPVTTSNATPNSEIQASSCDLMPVGIKLDIMYAHTGYVHGTVINEIIGAKMS
ncbi:Hypothetical predicted protein [Octopus vulgaris]|uniref:Tectonic-2 n=1 Tax=Octopus vulgaris TaxID=6645 RepID=A0AA36F5Q6_OCTVU|nr:Hypothetical predicted protein [Octopus vulgaris]